MSTLTETHADIVPRLEAASERVQRAHKAAASVIFGQDVVIERTLVTILSGGHALLIGVPGLAKTLLVETLGKVLGLDAKRVQFTPDLMPSDIIGSEVLEDAPGKSRSFRLVKGPIFTQLLMADEINRASPRTQSALLQAMQEHHVTVAGARYDIPTPFHVLATQNPLEHEGTYPLPEAQLDRFLLADRRRLPGRARRAAHAFRDDRHRRSPPRCRAHRRRADEHPAPRAPDPRSRQSCRRDPEAGAFGASRHRRQRRDRSLRRLGSRPARQPGADARRARQGADRRPPRTVGRRCHCRSPNRS